VPLCCLLMSEEVTCAMYGTVGHFEVFIRQPYVERL